MCPACKKLISSSVFSVFPDLSVLHFKCCGKRKDLHPVSGIDFSIFPIDIGDQVNDNYVLKPPQIY